MNAAPQVHRVAVIGLGLIGGSLTRLLVARGLPVAGWDPDPGTRELAAAAGIKACDGIAALIATEPDIVVVATPLRAVADTMDELAAHVGQSVTITDVGSVKQQVRSAAAAAGLAEQYVGAHPMAGNEFSGFESGTDALLEDVTWAVTVAPRSNRAHVSRVLRLITDLTRSRAIVLSDSAHDEAVAKISHLPHIVATELLAVAGTSRVVARLAAGSFRDGTRVARHGAARSQAMIESNGQACAELVRKTASDFARLADDLDAGRDTTWFFERPVGATNPLQDGGGVQIAWDGSWQEELVTVGLAGRAVIAVNDGGVVVEAAAEGLVSR